MAMDMDSDTIPLGLYLWKRIYEIGVKTVMGVPGDFQLDILDYIYDIDGMHFIGNSNELNAAYAADGYARVNHTPGCVVTTHGVGELSAINGIAGAASERIPLIHVVGQTPRMLQEKKLMIHHSIGSTGEVDAQLYNKTSKFIRADAAELWDGDKAPAEIDRVIRECVRRKAPVYIFMPLDLHAHRVKASLLEKKIDLRLPVDEGALRAAVEAVREAVCEAKRPVVFLDMLAHHAEEETRSFVDAVKLPVLAAHGAKAIVDGDHERFVGLYNGSVSSPGVADFIEGSDLVVAVGWWPADTNGGLGRKIGEGKRVDIMDEFVMVKGKRYESVYMASVLEALVKSLSQATLPQVEMPVLPKHDLKVDRTDDKITHNYIWSKFGSYIQPGDIVCCDTGASQYGLPDAKMPKDVTFFTQVYYGSIGYACPAALGADVARRERPRGRGRTVLVIGDGGLMLTVQEVAVMIAEGLAPVLVIINNYGYTIERAIHGARKQYNNVPAFAYAHMHTFFGGESKPGTNYHLATTCAEFEAAMENANVVEPKEVQVVEVRMGTFDIPWKLAGLLRSRPNGEEMARYLKEEGFTNA